MKSWAHTYMAGSLLGTALIVAALVAFVPLVSLTAPGLWPTPGLGLGGGGGSDAGVSGAVAVGGERSTGGLDSNPSRGPSVAAGAAVRVARAQGPEPHNGNGRRGGGETVASPEPAAVAPASAEVVARNPGPPAPESPAVTPSPPAGPTESGTPPVPATTGGEVAGLGETPSTPPVVAGVGGEEAESPLPPEDNESQPPEDVGSTPPPSGGSTEESNAPGLPGQDDKGEEAQSENGDAPPGSALTSNLAPVVALGPGL